MVQLRVGDTVTLCTAIWDFCPATVYFINDINVSTGPCAINADAPQCLDLSGVQVEFQWTNGDGTSSHYCDPIKKLKTLGVATTNSNGVASITYTIVQEDLTYYQNNSIFDLRVCIINKSSSQVTNFGDNRLSFHSGDNIQIISNSTSYTHYIDISIKPYSWYSPQGAADWIITKSADINGALLNLFSGITDWQYLQTDIITESNKVIIRIYLKDLNPTASSSLSITSLTPATLIAQIAAIVATLLYIVIAVGIIYSVQLITSTITSLFGKDYTKKEVGDYTNNTLAALIDDCKNQNLNNPLLYADCVKRMIKIVADGAGDFFNDPTIPQAGTTASTEIDLCTTQYNIDNDLVKFDTCIDKASSIVPSAISTSTTGNCWIPIGSSCLLSEKTGKALLTGTMIIAGGYVLYKFSKKKN